MQSILLAFARHIINSFGVGVKSLKYYLARAYREKWAIGQFNFSDFSQLKGIIEAAKILRSPVILGTSEGESRFFGMREAVALRNILRKETGLPIFLNLDHGKSFEYLKEAINAGYDMVHFDGSKLPLEENIKISRKVSNFTKWTSLRRGFGGQGGVSVEGEIGRIGKDASTVYQEKFEIKEEDLTNPKEARDYFKRSKTDILAVSIGNFHGLEITGSSPHLDLGRLSEIKDSISAKFVLHGGSGTPDEDIKQAIALGVVKVNINAETRLAFANALRGYLENNRDEIIPYKYLPEAVKAVQEVVENKIRIFGSEGKA